ncbi:hypothetical protein EVAR_9681_1 [Eumeta japonica]|uniref:Uncharacterized protein n=1 Tax=Eumeta variegata TaxID=151549 RepID=A0A4C1YDK5_EUMVA|nr:hypothetical protein EVAR_9681_1 [Eumeta japonica]
MKKNIFIWCVYKAVADSCAHLRTRRIKPRPARVLSLPLARMLPFNSTSTNFVIEIWNKVPYNAFGGRELHGKNCPTDTFETRGERKSVNVYLAPA